MATPTDRQAALAQLKAELATRYAARRSPARPDPLASGPAAHAAHGPGATAPPSGGRPTAQGEAAEDIQQAALERDGHPAWLQPGALHDMFAASEADGPATHGFAAGHAIRLAAGRPVVWVFHDMVGRELGRPHGEGLSDMGLAPEHLLLVRARNAQELLAATEEAARHPAVGAVIASLWGPAQALDLTASRRLALAAGRSGVAILCARIAARPTPGAAWSRWSVQSAPSRPLEGGAPGQPAYAITLLRHRGGAAPAIWTLEWDRAQRAFRQPPPLSGAVVPVPANRPVAPHATPGAAILPLRVTGHGVHLPAGRNVA